MSAEITATVENGIMRPDTALPFPDQTRVKLTIELNEEIGMAESQQVEAKIVPLAKPVQTPMTEGWAKLYALLGERFDSGHADTAERHSEHQP